MRNCKTIIILQYKNLLDFEISEESHFLLFWIFLFSWLSTELISISYFQVFGFFQILWYLLNLSFSSSEPSPDFQKIKDEICTKMPHFYHKIDWLLAYFLKRQMLMVSQLSISINLCMRIENFVSNRFTLDQESKGRRM